MSRVTLLATAIAFAVTAAVAASPAYALKKGSFVYVKKDGEMFSFRVIKLRKPPKIYAAFNKAFGFNPNMGPPETIPQEGGEHEESAPPSKVDNCYGYAWGGAWSGQGRSWSRD